MRAIFISYRRDDTEGQAGRLYDDLVRDFGDGSVFMDVAAIEPGFDFRKVIDKSVSSCAVLLALIGPAWLDAKDKTGQRRLDDPSDFVRLETAAALKRDIPVVPVLVAKAQMPSAEQLPDELKGLAYRSAVELTHARWDSDVQVLVKALRRLTGNLPLEGARIVPGGGPGPATKSWRTLVVVAAAAVAIAVGVGYASYAYRKAPDVSKVDPPGGHAPQDITISGSGFKGATKVIFGNAAATRLTVQSDNEVTTSVPWLDPNAVSAAPAGITVPVYVCRGAECGSAGQFRYERDKEDNTNFFAGDIPGPALLLPGCGQATQYSRLRAYSAFWQAV